jgi:NADPH:quinone reductase-like Zn-dependent oxidoreductase
VHPENGAFANYIAAKSTVQIKTPDNLTDEEAATLGISISTVVIINVSVSVVGGLSDAGPRTVQNPRSPVAQ